MKRPLIYAILSIIVITVMITASSSSTKARKLIVTSAELPPPIVETKPIIGFQPENQDSPKSDNSREPDALLVKTGPINTNSKDKEKQKDEVEVESQGAYELIDDIDGDSSTTVSSQGGKKLTLKRLKLDSSYNQNIEVDHQEKKIIQYNNDNEGNVDIRVVNLL